MEKDLKHALVSKPAGYYHVRDGGILPDDLLWSPMEKIYRRADDPEWMFPAPDDADLACCVIRKARYEKPPNQTERRYRLPSPRFEAPKGKQPDLFE